MGSGALEDDSEEVQFLSLSIFRAVGCKTHLGPQSVASVVSPLDMTIQSRLHVIFSKHLKLRYYKYSTPPDRKNILQEY